MGRVLVIGWASNVAALFVAAWLLSGVTYGDEWWTLLIAAAVFTVVNAWVKPVLAFLSIPFIIVTLGLFLLVINAAMLRLTSWLADELDIGFTVAGWWPAIGGAIVITLTTWVVDGVIGEKR
jgi:putative membrane protein